MSSSTARTLTLMKRSKRSMLIERAREKRILESIGEIDTTIASGLARDLEDPHVGGLNYYAVPVGSECPSCGIAAPYYSWTDNNPPTTIFRFCTACKSTTS